MGLKGAERCQQDWFLLKILGKNHFSCFFFPAFRGHPHSWAPGSLPSARPAMVSQVIYTSHLILTLQPSFSHSRIVMITLDKPGTSLEFINLSLDDYHIN